MTKSQLVRKLLGDSKKLGLLDARGLRRVAIVMQTAAFEIEHLGALDDALTLLITRSGERDGRIVRGGAAR